jgi:hypothetical protein
MGSIILHEFQGLVENSRKHDGRWTERAPKVQKSRPEIGKLRSVALDTESELTDS